MNKDYLEQFSSGVHLEEKEKRMTLKFVDAGRNNGNEREGNYKHGMGRQGRMEKENKTLGTGRCEKIETLYLNRNLYCADCFVLLEINKYFVETVVLFKGMPFIPYPDEFSYYENDIRRRSLNYVYA